MDFFADRRPISWQESHQRPCVVALTACHGPTIHGLDGYICEHCLQFMRQCFDNQEHMGSAACGYCGNNPTFVQENVQPVCQSCVQSALQTLHHWQTKSE